MAVSESSSPASPSTKKSLGDILDSIGHEATGDLEPQDPDDAAANSDGAESPPPKDGYCVECEGRYQAHVVTYLAYPSELTDQSAEIHCETCGDTFCEVCFASQHRKGSRYSNSTNIRMSTNLSHVEHARKLHKTRPLESSRTRMNRTTTSTTNGHNGNMEDEHVKGYAPSIVVS